MPFELTSSAFSQGQPIPPIYTCQGQNISPALEWSEPPSDTKSFVLICDDPDAPGGTWTHWIVINIPPAVRKFPEAIDINKPGFEGSYSGINSWNKTGYGGPCPPSGTHRYFFKLYALDTVLSLTGSVTKSQIIDAMNRHILDQAELMGTYRKS